MVSDPLGVAVMTPLQWCPSLPAAYTVLVWWRLALTGWAAHLAASCCWRGGPCRGLDRRSRILCRTGGSQRSPQRNLGSVQRQVGGSCTWAAEGPARWRTALDPCHGLLLALSAVASCTLRSPSASVAVWRLAPPSPGAWLNGLGALLLALRSRRPRRWPSMRPRPPSRTSWGSSTQELQGVRRTTGPADPVGYLRGGDFRSPDFRSLAMARTSSTAPTSAGC